MKYRNTHRIACAQEEESPGLPKSCLRVLLLYDRETGEVHREPFRSDRQCDGFDRPHHGTFLFLRLNVRGQLDEDCQGSSVIGDKGTLQESVLQGCLPEACHLQATVRELVIQRLDLQAFLRSLDEGSIQDRENRIHAIHFLECLGEFPDERNALSVEKALPLDQDDDIATRLFKPVLELLEEGGLFVVREHDRLEREIDPEPEHLVDACDDEEADHRQDEEPVSQDPL